MICECLILALKILADVCPWTSLSQPETEINFLNLPFIFQVSYRKASYVWVEALIYRGMYEFNHKYNSIQVERLGLVERKEKELYTLNTRFDFRSCKLYSPKNE